MEVYDSGGYVNNGTASQTFTGNITIDFGALTGSAVLRIAASYCSSCSGNEGVMSSDACNFTYRAEVEDYTLNITGATILDPFTRDDSLTVIKNSTSGVSNQVDVSANDNIGTSDGTDGDDYALNTAPTNGTVTEVSDGVFEYIPNADFMGSDSFTYNLCDANNDCDTATVNVVVNLGHCEPTSVSGGTHYITNFTIAGDTNTINNTSGDDGGYASYLDLTPADFTRNTSYTGSITVNGGNMGWSIYIDYNQNGSFLDAGELVGDIGGEGLTDLTFTVPNGALLGNTVMRVGARRYYSSNQPCGNGAEPEEFEDYQVEILNDATTQDIQLLGNGNSIAFGAVTTSTNNFTDFGIYDINSGALQRTFEITNDGVLDLTLTSPYVTLAGSADFTVVSQPASTVLAPYESTTFVVAFNPSTIGTISSTVSVLSDDPDENPFTFLIEGEGAQTFPDTDGDGVPDNIDEDDDNDGITDTEETNTCTTYPYATTTDLVFLNETFGAGTNRVQINGNYAGVTTTYCYEDGTGVACPSTYNPESVNDGDYTVHYTITNDDDVADGIDTDISNWAEDYWYAGEDHTPGDVNGRMAIFNADENPGVFYSQMITGATANVPIEFGFYAINIDRDDIDPTELATRERPNVIITIYDPNGNVIASQASGEIPPTSPAGDWVEVSASFTTTYTQFTVELSNANLGGLGNDLAIDDIFVKQTLCDLDGDGVADAIDLDNDNDGIPNVVELGLIDDNYDATVFNDTTNPWVDANGNGVHDAYESLVPIDSDGDGVPDYLDLDSDNDGIFDNVEYDGFGDIDVSGDGIGDGTDYQDTVENIKNDDPDGDGILSIMDDNDDDVDTISTNDHGTFTYPDPVDTDGDGIPDYLDVDSNDPLNDTTNGSDIDTTIYTALDADNDGVIDGSIDADKDGLLSSFDTDESVFGSPRDLEDSYSLYFDGRNDYVEELVNLVEGINEVSQMAWVKLDSDFSTEGVIMGQTNFYISILGNRSVQVYLNGSSTITTTETLPLNEWVHVSVTYNGLDSGDTLRVYINGEEVASNASETGAVLSSSPDFIYRIGRKPLNTGSQLYFKGEIDEARVFNIALSNEELQKMVYQELNDALGFDQGMIVPKDIGSIGGNLVRYFKMDGYKDDVTDNKVSPSLDLTGAKLYNIKNIYFQTAPLPYKTIQDGNWSDEATWEHGDVWDIEDVSSNKSWSVVQIDNEISTTESHSNLGLIVNDLLTVSGDNALTNSWYLALNGTIDLEGDSQLIQTTESDLTSSSTGKIFRRQDGVISQYYYNYWASPVGAESSTSLTDNNGSSHNANNSSFALNTLKDALGNPLEFTSAYHENGKVSTYWLYSFISGVTYYDWLSFDENYQLSPGVGYTQKGTGAFTEYTFEGKPNNGTILISATDTGGLGSVPAVSRTDCLLGNPYPSALDIHQFIDDNIGVIEGTLYLWQQWSGSSHILNEYNGGYATVNKTGSVRAYQFVGIEGANNGNQDGTKIPTRYLPVGQGFITEVIADGNIEFNNSQRVFIKESDADGSYNNGSVFFRGITQSTDSGSPIEDEFVMSKIRLEFKSQSGNDFRRELLLGFSEETTDDYDYGYDSRNTESYATDLSLMLDEELMMIQAYSQINQDKIIDLHLSVGSEGVFEIKATDFEDFSEDQDVYLRDNLTDNYHDLTSNQAYVFTSESGEFNNRFDIVFQNNSNTLTLSDEELENVKLIFASDNNKIIVLNPNRLDVDNITVYNTLGQLVYENATAFNSEYSEYNLEELSTGTYVVTMTTSNKVVITKKIIIK